ncbi:MAG: hypothetical protein V4649_19425 [Bacteroidota bacterium]
MNTDSVVTVQGTVVYPGSRVSDVLIGGTVLKVPNSMLTAAPAALGEGEGLVTEWRAKAHELRVKKVAMQDSIDSMASTLRPHELEQMAMVYDYCAEELALRRLAENKD